MNYALLPWQLAYGLNVPRRPTKLPNGWKVKVPPMSGVLSYAQTEDEFRDIKFRANTKLILEVKIEASANAVVDHKTQKENTGDKPAHIRPMLLESMHGDNNRWWSTTGIELKAGTYNIKVPLLPRFWSNVDGELGNEDKANVRHFNDSLSKPLRLALTVGGGFFYGHGARMKSGNMTITVKKYIIK